MEGEEHRLKDLMWGGERQQESWSYGLLLMAVICMATAVTVGDMQAMLRSFVSLYSRVKNIYTYIQIYIHTQTGAILKCTKGLSSTSSTGPRDDFKPLKIYRTHRD